MTQLRVYQFILNLAKENGKALRIKTNRQYGTKHTVFTENRLTKTNVEPIIFSDMLLLWHFLLARESSRSRIVRFRAICTAPWHAVATCENYQYNDFWVWCCATQTKCSHTK